MLANTNAVMRRIDLMCKLLAPILVGVVMSQLGALAGAVLIGLWHFFSVVPEYLILTWVYVAPQIVMLLRDQVHCLVWLFAWFVNTTKGGFVFLTLKIEFASWFCVYAVKFFSFDGCASHLSFSFSLSLSLFLSLSFSFSFTFSTRVGSSKSN